MDLKLCLWRNCPCLVQDKASRLLWQGWKIDLPMANLEYWKGGCIVRPLDKRKHPSSLPYCYELCLWGRKNSMICSYFALYLLNVACFLFAAFEGRYEIEIPSSGVDIS